jgi:hypothetical protein
VIVGVSAKGIVFEGEQVPVNKRMMEKEDAEQVSEEERKRLGGKKQKKEREERAQEKLDKELIDKSGACLLNFLGEIMEGFYQIDSYNWFEMKNTERFYLDWIEAELNMGYLFGNLKPF